MAFSLMQATGQQPIQRPRADAHIAYADIWQPLVCMILFAAAVALVHPAAEMGAVDDWSYAYTARELAASGRLVYNGWATAVIGPQAYWAALFIKLFGFSFAIVRLSTVVLVLLCMPVLYALGRQVGLRPSFASFGVLLCVFSPLFVPNEVTFLTDAPSFCFASVCMLGILSAWKAESFGRYALWLAVAIIGGGLAGSTRQIYWLLPLMSLAVLAFARYRQRDRAGLFLAAAALVMTAIGTITSLQWFRAQPYAVIGYLGSSVISLRERLAAAFSVATRIPETIGLLLIPVLVCFVAPARRLYSRNVWIGGLLAVAAVFLIDESSPRHWPPYLGDAGNMITEYGVYPGSLGGQKVVVLTPPIRLIIAGFLFAGTASFLAAAAWLLRTRGRGVLARSAVGGFAALTLPFAAVCALLMVARRMTGDWVLDRYLIPVLPIVSIPLLWLYQAHLRERVPAVAWVMLAIFGGYAVASTHDLFAHYRARLRAIEELRNSGVPRKEILAGFEYDGWTEIEISGHINEPRISPASAYRPLHACTGPPQITWFCPYVPSLRQRFILLTSGLRGTRDAGFPPVPYRKWLPPHEGQIFTQVLEEGGAIECR